MPKIPVSSSYSNKRIIVEATTNLVDDIYCNSCVRSNRAGSSPSISKCTLSRPREPFPFEL